MSQFGVELDLQTIHDARAADIPSQVSHMVFGAVAVEQQEAPEERVELVERLELEAPQTCYWLVSGGSQAED
jgi:hypothetical protein